MASALNPRTNARCALPSNGCVRTLASPQACTPSAPAVPLCYAANMQSTHAMRQQGTACTHMRPRLSCIMQSAAASHNPGLAAAAASGPLQVLDPSTVTPSTPSGGLLAAGVATATTAATTPLVTPATASPQQQQQQQQQQAASPAVAGAACSACGGSGTLLCKACAGMGRCAANA